MNVVDILIPIQDSLFHPNIIQTSYSLQFDHFTGTKKLYLDSCLYEVCQLIGNFRALATLRPRTAVRSGNSLSIDRHDCHPRSYSRKSCSSVEFYKSMLVMLVTKTELEQHVTNKV